MPYSVIKCLISGDRTPQIVLAWLIVCSVSVVLAEICLRSFHDLFPQALSNHVATGYHTGFSGIYRYNPDLRLVLMKPDFARDMYFNGYRWQHQTDGMGFRNPITRDQADVVLLGDSMVYGHGLEETHTLRHQLETLIQRPVQNLGMQGSSVHQEYHILKNFGLQLEPQFTFLFFLSNDIHDLTVYLKDAEMRQFLAQQTDSRDLDYILRSPQKSWRRFLYRIKEELYVMRAAKALRMLLKQHLVADAHAALLSWDALPLFRDNPRFSLAMQFHIDALRKMYAIARQHNIRLVNVFIYTGQEQYAQEEPAYEKILHDFCDTENIPFLSLREMVRQHPKRHMLFLQHDGHFSQSGARLVAQVLAEYMKNFTPPGKAARTQTPAADG